VKRILANKEEGGEEMVKIRKRQQVCELAELWLAVMNNNQCNPRMVDIRTLSRTCKTYNLSE